MEPITDAERLGWQLRSASALVDIIKLARKRDLPPLDWSVNPSGGGLVGRVSGLDRDAQGMRDAYLKWTEALAMDHRPRWERDGILCLRADNDTWGKYRARVCVMADIYPDE